MRFTTILPSLSLLIAGAIAAPASTPLQMQMQIQTLQIDILTVMNDIIQERSAAADFAKGTAQFKTFLEDLAGVGYKCPPGLPAPPTSEVKALQRLQDTQLALNTASGAILDSNVKSAITAACSASMQYASVSGWAKK